MLGGGGGRSIPSVPAAPQGRADISSGPPVLRLHPAGPWTCQAIFQSGLFLRKLGSSCLPCFIEYKFYTVLKAVDFSDFTLFSLQWPSFWVCKVTAWASTSDCFMIFPATLSPFFSPHSLLWPFQVYSSLHKGGIKHAEGKDSETPAKHYSFSDKMLRNLHTFMISTCYFRSNLTLQPQDLFLQSSLSFLLLG